VSEKMEWFLENREWIFSGIGVFILSLLLGILIKNKYANKTVQKQKSGKDSTNIQATRDINIGK